MKRKLGILMLAFVFFISLNQAQAAERLLVPAISSEYAILIDATTGNVLYEKNSEVKAYPASTTKILTAALALELNASSKMTTVSAAAAKFIGINGSNAGLKAGEKLSVNDLLHLALVKSANDAANAIAEAVSGSMAGFVDLMNKKVAALGLKNTTFLNPIGLDVEDGYKGHMTTARDLAFLMRYASSFKDFRTIIGKDSYQPPKTNVHTGTRPVYTNTNLLLTKGYASDNYINIGGKTGSTKAAKNTYVGCARNADGIELIVVLMKSTDRTKMFDEAKKLFDYGFDLVKANPEIAAKGFYDLRYRDSEQAINALYQRGILAGDGKGFFDYAAPASKEMFIKVLMDIRGVRPAASGTYWSESYLGEALAEALIDESWLTERSRPVTRGEVIRVLGNLIDLDYTPSDALALAILLRDFETLDDELKDSALEVCTLGIVPYLEEGAIAAEKGLTREELMMILCKFEEVINQSRFILLQ